MRNARYRTRKRCGFILADVVTAILLVTALAIALLVTMTTRHRVSRRLADDRAATRLAERVLVHLRAAEPRPAAGAASAIEVHRLSSPSGIDGQAWAEVRVKLNTGSATLIGLVPETAVRE